MPEKLCVFLRGVNVNGVKMKMDDLKKAFAALFYPDAQTLLATGNIIISANISDTAALKSALEAGLSDAFSYDAAVFLRTKEELQSVAKAASLLSTPQDCHLYYLITDNTIVIKELVRFFETLPHKEGETLIPIDSGALWVVPIGETLNSAFGAKALGAKRYKNALTSRNINTIEKILKALSA